MQLIDTHILLRFRAGLSLDTEENNVYNITRPANEEEIQSLQTKNRIDSVSTYVLCNY